MEYVLQPLILRRVRHSRILLAGIQAESGLDPRLKHSGVTVLGVESLNFVLFATFVVRMSVFDFFTALANPAIGSCSRPLVRVETVVSRSLKEANHG
jgi:hypothetical protein